MAVNSHNGVAILHVKHYAKDAGLCCFPLLSFSKPANLDTLGSELSLPAQLILQGTRLGKGNTRAIMKLRDTQLRLTHHV